MKLVAMKARIALWLLFGLGLIGVSGCGGGLEDETPTSPIAGVEPMDQLEIVSYCLKDEFESSAVLYSDVDTGAPTPKIEKHRGDQAGPPYIEVDFGSRWGEGFVSFYESESDAQKAWKEIGHKPREASEYGGSAMPTKDSSPFDFVMVRMSTMLLMWDKEAEGAALFLLPDETTASMKVMETSESLLLSCTSETVLDSEAIEEAMNRAEEEARRKKEEEEKARREAIEKKQEKQEQPFLDAMHARKSVIAADEPDRYLLGTGYRACEWLDQYGEIPYNKTYEEWEKTAHKLAPRYLCDP